MITNIDGDRKPNRITGLLKSAGIGILSGLLGGYLAFLLRGLG